MKRLFLTFAIVALTLFSYAQLTAPKGLTVKKTASERAVLGTELLTNGTFVSDLSSWTAGAGWEFSNGGATHTSGTATLVQNVTVASDSMYLVSVYQKATATSNFTYQLSSFGIAVTHPFADQGQTFLTNRVTFLATSTGSVAFTIIPSTTFNGTIDSVSIKKIKRSITNNSINFYRGTSLAGSLYIEPTYKNIATGYYSGNNLYPFTLTSTGSASFFAGGLNTFYGYQSGRYNSNGYANVFMGYNSGLKNTSGYKNSFVGTNAGALNTGGYHNTAMGFDAMALTTTGNNNVGIGIDAMYANTTGYRNTALGSFAMGAFTSGYDNVAIGYNAGYNSSAATYNTCIYIGAQCRPITNAISNSIGIGNAVTLSASNQVIIGTSATTRMELAGKLIMGQITAALTDGAPTDAEIDAATGLTPSTAGAGWQVTINDTDGTGLLYRIESDGTDWYYTVLTKAL